MKIFLGILFLIFITWGGWYVYKNFLFPEPSKPVDEDVPKKLINAQERIIRLESNSEISKDINDIKKLSIFDIGYRVRRRSQSGDYGMGKKHAERIIRNFR